MLSSRASNVGWSPRTVESNESTASPCNVSEVVVTAAKPKKKRVRRAKLELEFLRQESKKLEDELAQLLVIQAQRPPNTSCIVSTAQQITDPNGYRPIAPRLQRKPSVWQEIALRQSNARGRSLVRNLELRARLEAEIKLGKQLVQLLERQSNVKLLCRSVAKQDGTFKKLLERAEDLLLEMKKDLQGKAFSDPNASFNDTFVEKEGEKETFVMQANMTIPFCKDATAKALWKVLSSDEIDEYCYYHQVAHKTETVVAQVFGIHYNDGCMSADFRGRYIFSRFKEEDRIVIVWVAESELVELNGEKLSGVQGGTRGWIQVSDATTKKALVRSYSRLNMESRNQPDLSLHSFSNLFQRMHDRFLASYSATMEKALIEEDWKLSCG
ncbi:hypothetical protein DVH05_027832 [Phytophthora capsici]|nr:hypothetical protein DVH05_027832 [Phytophthora capsici]